MTYKTYQGSIRVEGWVKGDLEAKDFRTSWIRVQKAGSSEIRQTLSIGCRSQYFHTAYLNEAISL